jgi:hypothetical protein
LEPEPQNNYSFGKFVTPLSSTSTRWKVLTKA